MTTRCNENQVNGSSSSSTDLSIAVLAGGKSLRFGSDKALATLEVNGPPLLQIVIDRLRGLTEDLFIVASDRPRYARFEVPVHPDRWDAAGPLGGITTALATARSERCFVTSCDMPFLNPRLIRWMLNQASWPVVAPLLAGASRQGGIRVAQTLHAIYQKECLEIGDQMLASGERRVSALLERVPTLFLDAADVAVHDPDYWSFFSVNTPEALVQARAHWLSLQAAGQPPLY